MIHKLYVLPEFHGKGIGKAFIQWIEAIAINSGHQVLELKVFHKNKVAIKFYEHMGFSVYSEVQSEIGSKYTFIDLLMRKLL